MKRWVWWVIAGVVVVVLGAGWYYSTQTEQGHLWLLGLTSRAEVPNVVGQTLSSAEAALKQAGLLPGQTSHEPTLAVAPGIVTSQTPEAGSAVKKDAEIALAVSIVPTVTVPDVVGHPETDAETALAEQGLRTTAEYTFSSSVAAGEVIEQSPSAGTEASATSIVAITVSKGKQQGQVPNVIGLAEKDAGAVLSSAGFKVKTVKASSNDVPAGDVLAQSPSAGTTIATGATVTITISTGKPAPAAAPPAPAPAPGAPPATVPPASESPKVQVPDVVGQRVLEAVTTLNKAELKVAFEWERSEGDFLKVIKQAPQSGASADRGDTVTITIGLPAFSFEMQPPSVTPTSSPPAQTTEAPAPTPPSGAKPSTPPSESQSPSITP